MIGFELVGAVLIPTSLVNVFNRYMHSPVEVIQLDGLENIEDSIVKWCKLIGYDWRL